jgi:hypothetical protein
MPDQHLAAVARVPIPFDLPPQCLDRLAKGGLVGVLAREILPRREQALKQERRLDDVAAVVLRHEGDRSVRAAVEEMREGAMVARGAGEMIEHHPQATDGLLAGDPATLDGDDHRHGAETRSADGDAVGNPGAVAGKAAHRMSEVPEIAEGVPLDEVEKRGIVEALSNGG